MPGPISSLPATAGLPRFISFPTSYPELDSGTRLRQRTTRKIRKGRRIQGVRLLARERTIVALMGHGLTNKRIARELSIAPETVKSHAKRIFWKLTVQTRAEAVYQSLALGFI